MNKKLSPAGVMFLFIMILSALRTHEQSELGSYNSHAVRIVRGSAANVVSEQALIPAGVTSKMMLIHVERNISIKNQPFIFDRLNEKIIKKPNFGSVLIHWIDPNLAAIS